MFCGNKRGVEFNYKYSQAAVERRQAGVSAVYADLTFVRINKKEVQKI